jgi:LPXTG-site transpeptidase (sortase) family protein
MLRKKTLYAKYKSDSRPSPPALARINDVLTIVVVLIGLHIVLLPLLPKFTLIVATASDKTGGYKYQSTLADNNPNINKDALKPKPSDNRLVIPKINIDEKIIEGDAPTTVDKGVWRRPKTSTPDKDSNTVLVGHRFSYSDPATFYNLDKMKTGDRFTLFWDKTEYIYEVTGTKVVPPTAIEVESPTKDHTLTMYTCTPIWTAANRLVVTSNLVTKTPYEVVK